VSPPGVAAHELKLDTNVFALREFCSAIHHTTGKRNGQERTEMVGDPEG
jgi:hypothetical protein